MRWIEKSRSTVFDTTPADGLFFLNGDLLAQRHQQAWVKGKKYPVIVYPSGLQRELSESTSDGGIINIFGACELSRKGTRDEGFRVAAEFAAEYDYTVGRRGDNELLVFHPHSGHGYAVKYDNRIQQIIDVKRIPDHAMDLLDVESRAVLPELYANEKLGMNAIAPVKFFTPDANWTWYVTEYDGKDLFFGLVSGFEVEMGYFSLTELEGVRGRLGLPIERDLYFKPTSLKILKAMHEQ